ncbi:MAG TPA: hypothetical protein VKA31_05830 [Mariprofundaceae bacterium]|nr:hypothetical protein [Mariprofundaceae bacterium]
MTVAENGDSKLKVESLFYLNTTAHKADTNGVTQTKDTGLAVDRAYLTLKYSFNSDWMMRFTTDVESKAGGLTGKKQNIYLKYAYVEGKLAGDAAVLRLGQSHTPWIDYEQGLWKHRYVSKVMSDNFKFDDSSDLGIGLKGKLADGMVGYWVTETTGAGYGNGAGSTNGMDLNARIGIYPIEGLTLDVQFRDGYRGSKTFTGGAATAGVKSTMYQVMATYGMGHDFRVGVNYLSNKDKARSAAVSTAHGGAVSSGFATAALNDEVKSTGYGVWGWAKFAENFGAFGRYENLKNSLNGGTKEKVTHYVAGVDYAVTKGVTFGLAFDSSKLTNRAGTAGQTRKDTRYGLYTQVAL